MKKLLKVILSASLLFSMSAPLTVFASENLPTINASSVTVVDKSYIKKSVQLWGHDITNGYDIFMGSGFFIEGGYVIGAQHCIRYYQSNPDMRYYVLDGSNVVTKNFIPVDLVASDASLDLALFKSDQVDHPYFDIADHVNVGQEMFFIGNSYERPGVFTDFIESRGSIADTGVMRSITTGDKIVLSTRLRMMGTASAFGGDSGAPALNKNNEIIGVVVAKVNDNNNVLMAQLEDLKSFIAEYTK